MQFISNDQTIRSSTVQDSKDFNYQSLATQAKKGEKLVSLMPAIKKAFELMVDDIVELSTENHSLKNKIGSYDEKWLEEYNTKLLKQIDDKKSKFDYVYNAKTDEKTLNRWRTIVITNCGKVSLITPFLK